MGKTSSLKFFSVVNREKVTYNDWIDYYLKLSKPNEK